MYLTQAQVQSLPELNPWCEKARGGLLKLDALVMQDYTDFLCYPAASMRTALAYDENNPVLQDNLLSPLCCVTTAWHLDELTAEACGLFKPEFFELLLKGGFAGTCERSQLTKDRPQVQSLRRCNAQDQADLELICMTVSIMTSSASPCCLRQALDGILCAEKLFDQGRQLITPALTPALPPDLTEERLPLQPDLQELAQKLSAENSGLTKGSYSQLLAEQYAQAALTNLYGIKQTACLHYKAAYMRRYLAALCSSVSSLYETGLACLYPRVDQGQPLFTLTKSALTFDADFLSGIRVYQTRTKAGSPRKHPIEVGVKLYEVLPLDLEQQLNNSTRLLSLLPELIFLLPYSPAAAADGPAPALKFLRDAAAAALTCLQDGTWQIEYADSAGPRPIPLQTASGNKLCAAAGRMLADLAKAGLIELEESLAQGPFNALGREFFSRLLNALAQWGLLKDVHREIERASPFDFFYSSYDYDTQRFPSLCTLLQYFCPELKAEIIAKAPSSRPGKRLNSTSLTCTPEVRQLSSRIFEQRDYSGCTPALLLFKAADLALLRKAQDIYAAQGTKADYFEELIWTEELNGREDPSCFKPYVYRFDLPELTYDEALLLPAFWLEGRYQALISLKQALFSFTGTNLTIELAASVAACNLFDFICQLPPEIKLKVHGDCALSIDLPDYKAVTEAMQTYSQDNRVPQLYYTAPPEFAGLEDLLVVDLPESEQLPDTMLDLESLLQFDWKLTLGDKTLSEEDFELLRRNAGKIVRLHDKYVRADVKVIKRHQENQERRDRMSRHLVLLATLTGSYQDSKVLVGQRLTQVRQEIFSGIDTALPADLQGTLRPYQQYGYIWLQRNLKSGLGSILADDMGLGKTIQLIAVLLKLHAEGELKSKPALIVVPSSVLINWQRELKRFAPCLKVYSYHGVKRTHEGLLDYDVIVTTYGTLRASAKKLAGRTYRLIAADEAQKLKNHTAQTVKALKSLKGLSYIALTGTPVENRLTEYWSIMDFVNPGLLSNIRQFNREIANPIERQRDPLALDRLRRITGPFLLRRLKSDKSIIADLPDKLTSDEFCELTPVQASLYQAVLDDIMEKIRDLGAGDPDIMRSALVLQLINSLKQICNSPVQYLHGRGSTEYRMEDSGKVMRLIELCEGLLDAGKKTLIFTQYTQMGELLQRWLKETLKLDVPFIRGSLSPKQRQSIVDKFQADSDEVPLLLLSLKAGGTGLNLTAAECVIHFDLWWNPAVEEQATDRAYRIGQLKNVQVYRLITANTFEEKINAIIQSKRELSELTMISGNKWIGELTNEELTELFSLTREDMGV